MSNFIFASANHLKIDDLVCDYCIYAMVKAGEVEIDNSHWDDLLDGAPPTKAQAVKMNIADPMELRSNK